MTPTLAAAYTLHINAVVQALDAATASTGDLAFRDVKNEVLEAMGYGQCSNCHRATDEGVSVGDDWICDSCHKRAVRDDDTRSYLNYELSK